MDLYNIKQIISNATFYDTAIEQKIYFEGCIIKATNNYNKNKNNIEPYAIKTIQLGNKETGFKVLDLDKIHGKPRPKITHKQAFETKYNDFIKAIKKEIGNLSETIELETDLLKCNNINNSKDKYFCLIRLKNLYTLRIDDNKVFFAKEQPEYHKKTVTLYTTFLKRINKQLKQIKIKKQPKEKETKRLSLNPNFDDFNGQINIIYTETQHLFTSTLDNWHNLFSNDIQIFKNPIELKQKTTIADLRLLLDKLSQKGLIKNSRFNKLLQTVKAFSYNGLIITANQYKDAKQTQNYPNTLNSNIIQDVFNSLNVD